MPDKDKSWHLVKERHTWLYGMVGSAGARQWAGYHGVRLGSARGDGRTPCPQLQLSLASLSVSQARAD